METKVIQKNKGKVLVGKVVSTKMKDTVVISIDSFKNILNMVNISRDKIKLWLTI